MKLTRGLLALAINFSFAFTAIFVVTAIPVSAQSSNSAIERGYRTGYSDGYMAGYRDSIDSLERSIARHREYSTADRAFSTEYGSLEDFRDGYRQGFTAGYDTGFDKKTFDSSIPAELGRKGVNGIPVQNQQSQVLERPNDSPPESFQVPAGEQGSKTEPISDNTDTPNVTNTKKNTAVVPIRNASYVDDAVILIPKDIELVLELQEDLSTSTTRQGERFTAKVLSPMELDGAIVEGHIEKIKSPGRLGRHAELQLSFDRIVMPGNRWSNFGALLIEIVPIKGDNVKGVNDEGKAIGQSSMKGDAIKIGASTGAGAGIGAIAGGPVGAAIGAGIGAAFGVGVAVIDKGKHIRLNRNQQMKVRSVLETRIR